ncbi:MAG: hypothetical protein Tsb0021_06960 [Chlamydiales bacterium]
MEQKLLFFLNLLATTGYSYFNREHVSHVAETIPGQTTNLFSQVAMKYGMYVVLGLPEHATSTNLYYNSAVFIGPDGSIDIYRKHSHLMEASWSALGTGKIPIFDTCCGKLAILICADINYSELTTQVAL